MFKGNETQRIKESWYPSVKQKHDSECHRKPHSKAQCFTNETDLKHAIISLQTFKAATCCHSEA